MTIFAESKITDMKKVAFVLSILCLLLSSCTTSELLPTEVARSDRDDLSNYAYFYTNPAGSKTGSSGAVYGTQYGTYGASSTKTTEPCDLITGFLIQKGFVRVPNIDDTNKDKTFIVSYGETGRRACGWGYAIQVVLQFTSAKTNEVICTVTGEGQGETEADDVRIAIRRCLETVFPTE